LGHPEQYDECVAAGHCQRDYSLAWLGTPRPNQTQLPTSRRQSEDQTPGRIPAEHGVDSPGPTPRKRPFVETPGRFFNGLTCQFPSGDSTCQIDMGHCYAAPSMNSARLERVGLTKEKQFWSSRAPRSSGRFRCPSDRPFSIPLPVVRALLPDLLALSPPVARRVRGSS
jgi:hypothetical protein